jgi:hypothetical protein
MRMNDLLHDFVRNAGHPAILPQVRAWFIHVLAENYYFPYTGLDMVSAMFSECISFPH